MDALSLLWALPNRHKGARAEVFTVQQRPYASFRLYLGRGLQRRERGIKRLAEGAGRSCPALEEVPTVPRREVGMRPSRLSISDALYFHAPRIRRTVNQPGPTLSACTCCGHHRSSGASCRCRATCTARSASGANGLRVTPNAAAAFRSGIGLAPHHAAPHAHPALPTAPAMLPEAA